MLDRVKGWLFAEEEIEPETLPPSQPAKRRPLLSLHASRNTDEIFLRRPKSLDDAQVCADCLKARRPVVVNVNALDDLKARRVLDFLGGVVYAVDGYLEQAGEGIYLLTPNSVVITAETNGRNRAEESFAFSEP
jgi:cell division inhibitor SepF